MINDMYVESGNDDYKYPVLAKEDKEPVLMRHGIAPFIDAGRFCDSKGKEAAYGRQNQGITVEIGGDTTGLSRRSQASTKKSSPRRPTKDVNSLLNSTSNAGTALPEAAPVSLRRLRKLKENSPN